MVSVVDGVASDVVSGLGVGEYVVVACYGENGVYRGGVGVGELVVDFISGFVADVGVGSDEWCYVTEQESLISGSPSIDSDGVHTGMNRQVVWKKLIPIPSVVTINGYSSANTDRRVFFFIKTGLAMGDDDTRLELFRDIGDTVFRLVDKNGNVSDSVTVEYPPEPYTFKIILTENYSVLRIGTESYLLPPLTVDGSVARKCYYAFRKWGGDELITTGVNVGKLPYTVKEGNNEDGRWDVGSGFVADHWNKSSQVTIYSDNYHINMSKTGNVVAVYTGNKLMRGDGITVWVNPTSASHLSYKVGLTTVNSTTKSEVNGGHIVSFHKESGLGDGEIYSRVEQGSNFAKVADVSSQFYTTMKPITFTTNSNNQIVVIVDGESVTTTTTLPASGAYLYVVKPSGTYDMVIGSVVYGYGRNELPSWTESAQYPYFIPHNPLDWRQYSLATLSVNNTNAGNTLIIPTGVTILYPLELGKDFRIELKMRDNGATTKAMWFGLYKGNPSYFNNNFNTGMITDYYHNGSSAIIQGLGSNTSISWATTTALQTVKIKATNGTVTYELGDGDSKVSCTRPTTLGTQKVYFCLKNSTDKNISIAGVAISTTVTPSRDRTPVDFVSIEGEIVSDTSIPRTAFSDSYWNKTQSGSLAANNGTRLFLTPSTTSTTVANIACTKYVAIRRGEAVEIGLYIYQNDIDNNTVNMRVGLSTTTGTTYGSLTILAQYFQSTSHQVIANNTSNQTTTNTLGPTYKYVGFWVDKDGKITVKVDGEAKTTNAILPENGAYLFISNYRQKSSIGIHRIYYHSYSGL